MALDEIPAPDFADVHIVPLPAGSERSASDWAGRIFDVASMPPWVAALMGLRQAVVGLVGIQRAESDVFAVVRTDGEESLIDTDEAHVRFCCAVAVDSERQLLRMTTAVQLKGWRGRLYFAPVSVLHGPVVRSIMLRAVRRG